MAIKLGYPVYLLAEYELTRAQTNVSPMEVSGLMAFTGFEGLRVIPPATKREA